MSTNGTMNPVLEDSIIAAIHEHWNLGRGVALRRHGHGMNSATWLVTTATDRLVAKAVSSSAAAQFDAGLVVAAVLGAAGMPAGAPFPTLAGAVSVPVEGYQLALLQYEAGRGIDPRDLDEQWVWGATLARAHALLRSSPVPSGAQLWHWVDPDATHLDIEPWIRPAVRSAVARLHALQQEMPLTFGLLHADPAPEAFLVDGQGRTAIIDWGAVTWGPLLYDIASARLYAGDDATFANVLAGYLSVLPLQREELIALPHFLRFRWAVQADYFARRIQARDVTGLTGPAGNGEGLAAARRFLAGI